MKNINKILMVLIIICVVSVSGCITFLPDPSNVTISNLNNSDVPELKTISEIKTINKPTTPVKPVEGLLSKEEIKKAYEGMFPYTNATVSVSRPYKMNNGTYYYVVDVEESYDDVVSILHLEVDAKVKPELIESQGFEAKGVLSEYFYTLKKDDGTFPKAKISEKIITVKANELFKKYAEDEKVFMVDLLSTKDDKLVYVINMGSIIYDANTGELIYCVFDDEPSNGLSEVKCTELAQKELDALDIPGAYLSEPKKLGDVGEFIYIYNVSYDFDGKTVNLGTITVSPFSLKVLDVDVNLPKYYQQNADKNQVEDSEVIEDDSDDYVEFID